MSSFTLHNSQSRNEHLEREEGATVASGVGCRPALLPHPRHHKSNPHNELRTSVAYVPLDGRGGSLAHCGGDTTHGEVDLQSDSTMILACHCSITLNIISRAQSATKRTKNDVRSFFLHRYSSH
jgi:hypothetical protein